MNLNGDLNKFNELSFLEAANYFNALLNESPVSLHPNHHKQIEIAVNDFQQKIMQENSIDKTIDIKKGPNEERALVFLDGFLSFDFISNQEKNIITLAKRSIELAKFQKLQREINKLKTNTKKIKLKPTELVDALMKILNSYPLENISTETKKNNTNLVHFKPQIVISQSFN